MRTILWPRLSMPGLMHCAKVEPLGVRTSYGGKLSGNPIVLTVFNSKMF